MGYVRTSLCICDYRIGVCISVVSIKEEQDAAYATYISNIWFSETATVRRVDLEKALKEFFGTTISLIVVDGLAEYIVTRFSDM